MRNLSVAAVALLFLISTAGVAYDRSEYRHWVDLDDDGQNTREEILIRDSVTTVTRSHPPRGSNNRERVSSNGPPLKCCHS